jgi:hypothetical protein
MVTHVLGGKNRSKLNKIKRENHVQVLDEPMCGKS